MLDQRSLYVVSLAGLALDGLGGLYLAYDLFGGKRGTLRTLTKAVTYGLLLGFGFGLPLGLWFGLVGGFVMGPSLAVEFSAGRSGARPRERAALPLVRALFLGFAGAVSVNAPFGVQLGLGTAAFQGVAHAIDPEPFHILGRMPTRGIKRRAIQAAVLRGASLALAAVISGAWAWRSDIALRGLEIALVGGGLSGLVGAIGPSVEWWADHLPARRLGAYGAALVVMGSALQACQYRGAACGAPLITLA